MDGGVFDCVAGEGFGCDYAFDAREGFGAGGGVGGADVDGQARVVDYDVFGVAGLDGGAGYDGGVVAVLALAKGRYGTGEVARVSFSCTPFFFPFPWLGDSIERDSRWWVEGEASTHGSTSRLTIVCSLITVLAAITTGSTSRCGIEACPPRPCSVTLILSAALISNPL